MKTCVECRYWELDPGYGAYSEMTPGQDASTSCTKGHWYLSADEMNSKTFREIIAKAATCPDFVEQEWVP